MSGGEFDKVAPAGPKDCATCGYAQFVRTPTGSIKANYPGRCHAEPVLNFPDSVVLTWSRNGVWPDDGLNCDFWKAQQ